MQHNRLPDGRQAPHVVGRAVSAFYQVATAHGGSTVALFCTVLTTMVFQVNWVHVISTGRFATTMTFPFLISFGVLYPILSLLDDSPTRQALTTFATVPL